MPISCGTYFMSLLTVVEASKNFNVGRTAIYKAIKKGELTPQLNEAGVQMLDPQDMIRVFGNRNKKPVSTAKNMAVSVDNDELVKELRLQIEELKQDKVFLKQEITSVRRDFDDFKLLIEHQAKTEVTKTAKTEPKLNERSFSEQKKQVHEQVETKPENVQNQHMVTGFLSRLLKLK